MLTMRVRPQRRTAALFLAAPLLAAACSSADSGAPTDTPTLPPSPVAEAVPSATAAVQENDATVAEGIDAWRDIELTDVGSGDAFTLASLAGQVVAIEPMAIWCTNCKVQQDNVKQVYGDIEAAGVRYISLGIDPNEDAGALAKYADRRGYGWTFAKSPTELSRALSDLFGSQILSPPSTPLIVLDPSGEIVIQEFGFHGPDALLEILREAGA